jgi:hypothetical protein
MPELRAEMPPRAVDYKLPPIRTKARNRETCRQEELPPGDRSTLPAMSTR